jgi:hypothetical protein
MRQDFSAVSQENRHKPDIPKSEKLPEERAAAN